MKKTLLAVLTIASISLAHAQDFDVYKTILPQGPVPKDFTEQTSLKVANEITNVTGKNARQRRVKKKFVLESTFSIDDFLSSGNVLFNDDVSLYLDAVLQEILKSHPDLKKKVRVYAVKSASVNAFTTNNGLIFVNLGLLSRLENEAQLAFVLSHEVVHYQKKHVINSYVNNIEIEQGRGDYRKLKVTEKGFSKSTYSKELETEADLDGAGIYLKSGYIKDSIDRIFDVLKFADYPLYWGAFQKSDLESGRYVFPDSLTLDHVKSINVDEDFDDSSSSHPNIKKRREGVRTKFKNEKGGLLFKISATRFNSIRKISRYELCRQFLLEHRYVEALALGMSLQKENPSSSYLRETLAKAYYGLALQSVRDELKLFRGNTEMGETGRIVHFLKNQSSYELCVLALRQLYFCQEASPKNVEISLMLKHLIIVFSEHNEGVRDNFLRTTTATPNEKLPYPYTQFAFLDFKNTPAFFEVFDKNIFVKKQEEQKGRRKKKEKKKSLKVNKVVVVNPMYKKIDTRKKQRVRHIEAEETLININDKINDAASELSMKADIINPNTMTSGQCRKCKAILF